MRLNTRISRFLGFRFVTKAGSKGADNLGKAIPAIGALAGGSADIVSAKTIAKQTYKNFIENGFEAGEKRDPDVFEGEIIK